ncbi:MAG: peptidoglycan DD-metalloendopeptidase family protein, partial [Deltaproteobacteria bacterium]|nr:peptidoglycan DD-metalloendopeptidase family protein [Nannocystaceae bacterium]
MRFAPAVAVAVAFVAAALAPALAWAEPPLHLPWACDDLYHVTNGHQTSSHTGKDAWAWDFGLAVGTEVIAPADGVVRLIKMNSSQGGCDGAYANDANYVVVDFDDGTEALLMHLQQGSSDLEVGDAVAQGDVVGKVGLTGWVCGAHLHFQIQQTCDSWWCQSIHAEFVDFGDPDEDVPLESNNCPVVEPCPLALDGTTTIVDDAEARCFQKVSSWFWPGDGGWDDGHIYTWANDAAEPDTIGRWEFGVDVPGRYRLAAFVPDDHAASQQASYEINTGAETITVGPIDQSTQKGWVDLGVHELALGDAHWVRMRDNTGEARDLDRELAFDAIRWEWEPITDDSGDSSGAGSSEAGSASGEGETAPADDGA